MGHSVDRGGPSQRGDADGLEGVGAKHPARIRGRAQGRFAHLCMEGQGNWMLGYGPRVERWVGMGRGLDLCLQLAFL